MQQQFTPFQLRNSYFALRHAHSKANLLGRIASQPRHCLSGYGLSARGIAECQTLFSGALPVLPGGSLRIISSDYLRALQTARWFAASAGSKRINITRLLRERNFGRLELQKDHFYNQVWIRDRQNAAHRQYGVESLLSVERRIRALVVRLEKRYSGDSIIMVSHGDVLAVLQCFLRGIPCQLHRRERPLRNAELRRMH